MDFALDNIGVKSGSGLFDFHPAQCDQWRPTRQQRKDWVKFILSAHSSFRFLFFFHFNITYFCEGNTRV